MRAPTALQRPETAGLLLLLFTTLGWGLNWPAMKLLLQELPPFSARAWPGFAAAATLASAALALGQSLTVPRAMWGRLVLISLLNYSSWMGFATLSLLWLSAGEGTIVCYTMPVWAALFAWPVLGERPTRRRLLALGLGLAGVLVLLVGPGVDVGLAKLPGVLFGLTAAVLFALGTVLTKRRPLGLPPVTAVVWQVGIGSVPIAAAALAFEGPDFAALSPLGWKLMAYGAAVPLCLCYVTWFAALRRLPASAASIGTLLSPVVGVLAAAATIGEPLGPRMVVALLLTVGGILLAVRG